MRVNRQEANSTQVHSAHQVAESIITITVAVTIIIILVSPHLVPWLSGIHSVSEETQPGLQTFLMEMNGHELAARRNE